MLKFLKKLELRPEALIVLILILGFTLRIYNYSWDRGAHLHPDERYMVMVTDDIKLPGSIQEYFDPTTSPFSPYNQDFKQYAYGTVPLHTVKLVSVLAGTDNYEDNLFLGRAISAALDTMTIFIVYLLTRFITPKLKYRLFGALLYAFCVLGIQAAHFYTVESFLNFFVALNLLLIGYFVTSKSKKLRYEFMMVTGISLCTALAIGTKFTALLILVLAAAAVIFRNLALFNLKNWKLDALKFIFLFGQLILFTYLFLRIVYPYFFASGNWFDFQMNTDLADILDFLNKAQNGEIMYPPQWQWLGTIAYIFPLRNLILWEFGPIAAIFSLTGLIVFVIYICKGLINKNWYTFLINKVLLNPLFLYTGYMLVYFIYLGGKFVKAGRYFFPIYIPLILLGVWLISKIKGKWKNIIMLIVILSQICCGLAYLNIYIQENTRVAASLWIYNNIPANSQITYELWDDSLPLGLNISTPYNINEMTVFDDPDNAEKLEKLYTPFSKAEYIILSSARAKYTIGKLPATFPHMVNYYKKLDNGQLGFKLVHEEHSYPSLFGLEFNDESAEEPFWVYDHPTVWIYKRDRQLSLEEFKDQLTQPLDTFVDDD